MAIYTMVSRDFSRKEVSSPAKIARYFKDAGFRASIIESPYRSAIITMVAPKLFLPEWANYSKELWSWTNWVTRWPRGVRERDFDNDARLLMLVNTCDGMHYLLARRDAGQYYVMDPAFATDQAFHNFSSWAGMHWVDGKSWNPNEVIETGEGGTKRQNYYLGISIWINTANAAYVYY
ncbi:hypothetical protein [Chromobacterium sp. ASV23]|uniref:hypothetical protein n=1 Tax=Chromobacterium sp. ASV23 TaxID=2795110 RepID=UPI0018EA9C5D|nr:hypothetical protein [Chromobacterium sp. ASV23]